MNPFRKARPRADVSRPIQRPPLPLFDELEQRVMLSVFFGEALPDLAAMENTNNIIVRFNTNIVGDDGLSHFDMELFVSEDDDPLRTVENFLDYVRRGQYDGMFFQRLQNLNANSAEPPEILQGGRNRLDEEAGQVTVIDVGDSIDDEVVRENLERTVAMAKTNSPDSATSQFFINLTDNEEDLSPDIQPNGGFPVFGQILGDRSWDLLMTIASLDVEDLQQSLRDPQFGGNPFPAVPVTEAFYDEDATMFTDEMFVTVLDAEVIKPEGVSFFDQAVYLSEGYRNFRSREILTVSNTNDEEADFQVILRYATTEDRDFVIDFGTLEAGETREIVLSGAGAEEDVRGFIPYAIEVQTASNDAPSVPVSATLRRSDFAGVAEIADPFAGEAFFNPEAIDTADREDTLRTWVFADGLRDDVNGETYITWVNLSDDAGEVTIEFFFEDGTTTQLVTPRELGAYRRGGVNVEGIGTSVLPEGAFGARVTSTVPIVATMSQYRLNEDDASDTGAALALGQPGPGGPIAAIADIRRSDDGPGRLAVVNLGDAEAVVRLDFIDNGGAVFSSVFNRVGAGNVRSFDLNQLPGLTLVPEQEYALRVSVQDGGPAIAAQFTTAGPTGGGGESVLSVGGTRHVFASAMSSEDAGFEEAISVYNPGSASSTVNYLVHFSDGTRLSVNRTVAAGERLAIDFSNDPQSDLNDIQDKIESADEFSTFSVTVTTSAVTVSSITRLDADGTRTTSNGTILSGLAPLV